jgi:NAD(P)-dependent dehydrogenase (short-subunit alcohol dehydrogenase family)
MDRFKGKTAVITGGTTGIGLATAKLFINEGARVIVTGRTAATIKSAQAELGDNAIVVRSDATSFSDMDALAAKVKETFGKLDVLFVNAGYGQFIPFESVTEEVYDEMLNLNAKGPYFIAQKLVPLMPEGSSVVFTTSMANVKAVAPLSAYGDGHTPEGRNAEGGGRSGLCSDGAKRSDEASRPAGGNCQGRGVPGD